jgi:hypothetical protein
MERRSLLHFRYPDVLSCLASGRRQLSVVVVEMHTATALEDPVADFTSTFSDNILHIVGDVLARDTKSPGRLRVGGIHVSVHSKASREELRRGEKE